MTTDGTADREPVAVVGIGCRLPGGADCPDTLWRLLLEEFDAIGPIPAERFDVDALFDPRAGTPGHIATRWTGALSDLDRFDASFFEIAPREAERLDPQQRLLLETAWEALEDAGLPRERVAGTNAGVFVGMWLNEFEARAFADPGAIDLYMTTGSGRYAASGRLSFFLDLHGPSVTIDTACSSSLVAVHLACQSLRSGECDLALAGGANVILEPSITVAYSQSGMLAADGRCKFGDAAADGYVRSDGAAVVVLKRLSSALADGDAIHGVVLGSAVTNDGRSSGFLATPGQAGQEEMLRRAYASAGVDPRTVQYVEAHGTGTAAGDPVELGALGAVIGAGRRPGEPCLVGSLKSNVGHTEGAAGVAGLVKAVLALEHGVIPASLHVHQPNPAVPWTELGLEVCAQRRPWPDTPGRARAGVSSFGIAGTNAHVVLEAPPSRDRHRTEPRGALLLPVSAQSPNALVELAAGYEALLSRTPAAGDVCAAAARGRTHHRHRLAVVGGDGSELAAGLRARAAQPDDRPAPKRPSVTFVFPGQGSQWVGMGRELQATEPAFRDALRRCDAAIASEAGWSVLAVLEGAETARPFDDIDVVQPTLFAMQVALDALWRAWGIEPDAVVGHSMGEIAGAHVAGALALEDAVAVICRRSALLRRVAGQGAMAVVDLGPDETEAALRDHRDRVSVAVSNSPRSTVISGDPAAIDEVLARLEASDVFCRRVKVDVASHSPQMDPLLDDLGAALDTIAPRPTDLPMYSTVDAEIVDGPRLNAGYWARNLRRPVRFGEAIARAAADGHDVVIEISPHPILLPAVEEVLRLGGHDGAVVASLRRDERQRETMLAGLAALYERGAAVEWRTVLGEPSRRVRLPAYPWQRERFWYEPARRSRPGTTGHPLLGPSVRPAADSGTVHWQTELAGGDLAFLADHVVHASAVMPAAGFVEMLLAAAAEGGGDGRFQISELTLHEMLAVESDGETAVQTTLQRAGADSMRARVLSVDPSGTAREHAVAAIGPAVEATPVPVPIEAVRARCSNHQDGAVHDTAMRRRGLAYGEAFRTVQECWVGCGEALGRLARPTVDPVARRIELLDGALQVGLAALPAATARDTYLPVRLGRVRTTVAWPGRDDVWAHAVVTRRHDDSIHCDVTVTDVGGDVVAEIADVELRRTGTATGALADLLYDVGWRPAERHELDRPAHPTTWLVYTAGGVGHDLATRLTAGGDQCVLVSPGPSRKRRSGTEFVVDPGAVDDHRAVLDEVFALAGSGPVGIVYAWAAAIPGGDAGSTVATEQFGAAAPLALLQALGARQDGSTGAPSVRLWLVTSGAQAAGPMTAARFTAWPAVLWGLGRVVATERPALQCTLIDLDPGRTDDAGLWAEVVSRSEDQQVVLRAGERLVARLERLPMTDAPPRQSPAADFRLYAATPGSLDSLRLRLQTRRPPGAGEVEVRIDASGLNFLDVLKAMAVYPGIEPGPEVALGAEGAGIVTAVGPGVVDVGVGDEVVVITPSYDDTSLLASHATVPESFVVRRPANVPLEAAAALPIAYLTAYYALGELARVRAGERVLVHSATGGVGLAALHLCRALGAEVIATAGSEARRAQLRTMGVEHVFDSRHTTFAEEVRTRTGGRGVDVVLNSLPGDAVPAGLTSLAPRGRFVEIGKRDVYNNARLDLAPFRDNISFFVVDVARLTAQDPTYVSGLFRTVMAMVADGRLPALPATAAPITSASEVFRTMAQAGHTGKLVLTRPAGPVSADTPYVRPDATYLITGGLGALGLAVARRFARRGARHLVLLGRSAPSPAAAAAVEDLRRHEVDVRIIAADVTDATKLSSAVAMVRATMPPLRGVVHAAGTLADATIDQMDAARLRAALAPKLVGAWNLHRATLDDPLELFVLFSSAAAVLGLAGQANYAAGNAFLDALAHQRRLAGRPATSVAWGPWSDIGLATVANRGDRLAARGLEGLAEDEALDALEWLVAHDRAGAAVMRFDASAWLASEPSATAMVADLVTDAPEPAGGRSGWRERLLALPRGPRRRVELEDALCVELAAVLRIPADRIDRHLPLKALGLDSLMALELRNRLEAVTVLDLPATVIWNHPSVTLLAAHLAARMAIALEAGGEPVEPEAAAATAESGPTQAELEALLDEELAAVERLLDTEGRPS